MNDNYKLKSILYKAKYRGSKELDHIVLTFAQKYVSMTQDHDALLSFLDRDDRALFSVMHKEFLSPIEKDFRKFLIDIQWLKDKNT